MEFVTFDLGSAIEEAHQMKMISWVTKNWLIKKGLEMSICVILIWRLTNSYRLKKAYLATLLLEAGQRGALNTIIAIKPWLLCDSPDKSTWHLQIGHALKSLSVETVFEKDDPDEEEESRRRMLRQVEYLNYWACPDWARPVNTSTRAGRCKMLLQKGNPCLHGSTWFWPYVSQCCFLIFGSLVSTYFLPWD